MVQGRDARLVATDCKRSRRSGAGSDKPKKEVNTPNSLRRAGNAKIQQTQALLPLINNVCQDYMANNEGWEQPRGKGKEEGCRSQRRYPSKPRRVVKPPGSKEL